MWTTLDQIHFWNKSFIFSSSNYFDQMMKLINILIKAYFSTTGIFNELIHECSVLKVKEISFILLLQTERQHYQIFIYKNVYIHNM